MNYIDLPTIAAFARHAESTASRPYIHGVALFFDEDHTTYVATDGKTLIARRCQSGTNHISGSVLVPLHICKALKFKRERIGLYSLTAAEATIKDDDTTHSFPIGEFNFPDWKRLVPRPPSGERPFAINHELVARVYQTAKKLKLGPVGYHPNGDGPAVFNFGLDADALAIVMPLRDVRPDRDRFEVPGWI